MDDDTCLELLLLLVLLLLLFLEIDDDGDGTEIVLEELGFLPGLAE